MKVKKRKVNFTWKCKEVFMGMEVGWFTLDLDLEKSLPMHPNLVSMVDFAT